MPNDHVREVTTVENYCLRAFTFSQALAKILDKDRESVNPTENQETRDKPNDHSGAYCFTKLHPDAPETSSCPGKLTCLADKNYLPTRDEATLLAKYRKNVSRKKIASKEMDLYSNNET